MRTATKRAWNVQRSGALRSMAEARNRARLAWLWRKQAFHGELVVEMTGAAIGEVAYADGLLAAAGVPEWDRDRMRACALQHAITRMLLKLTRRES